MNLIRFILITSILGVIFSPVHAQKGSSPNPDDIQKAKELKTIYEDDRLASLETTTRYSFEYNSKTDKVVVNEAKAERIISLESNASYTPYIFYDEESSVKDVEVYNHKGKRMSIDTKDEYYNISDYFYSDARIVHYRLKFPVVGSNYTISHRKEINDIKYLTSSYFNAPYPIGKRKIQFLVPKWLDIELKEMNFEGYDIKKTVKQEKNDVTLYSFEITDLEGTTKERDAPGHSHIYPHILVLSKSYTIKGKQTMLFNSAKDLYAWYRSLITSMDDDPKTLNGIVEELLAGKDTDVDKIKSIYYWVQDNIRYIAFEDGIAGFQPDLCQNVYNNKYGDCKGMANLTKQMLNIAGYDARLTWIGTKRIAYDYSLPTMAVDNHMICTVILNGQQYFLDPTEKFGSFNEYAGRIEGKQVMIEDGENFILSSVPKMAPEKNAKVVKNKLSIQDEDLIGTVSRKYTGESKAYILYQVNHQESSGLDESLNNFITRRDKNLIVNDLKTSDFKDRDDVLTMDYQIVQKNSVAKFGEEIYLDLDFYKEYSHYDFKDRKVAYMFPHKSDIQIEIELEIPDGYNVQEIPSDFKKENDIYTFNMGFVQNGNKLIYKKRITIKKDQLPKKSISDWNSTIKELNDFYKEQVVLHKE